MGPTWGPSGADRTQVGPMLAPWTLLCGTVGRDSRAWPTMEIVYSTVFMIVYDLMLFFLKSRYNLYNVSSQVTFALIAWPRYIDIQRDKDLFSDLLCKTKYFPVSECTMVFWYVFWFATSYRCRLYSPCKLIKMNRLLTIITKRRTNIVASNLKCDMPHVKCNPRLICIVSALLGIAILWSHRICHFIYGNITGTG